MDGRKFPVTSFAQWLRKKYVLVILSGLSWGYGDLENGKKLHGVPVSYKDDFFFNSCSDLPGWWSVSLEYFSALRR